MATELIHLSGVIKKPLRDAKTGDRLGSVEDFIIRIGDAPHPPIVGLVVKIGDRELFVPIRKIADIQPGGVTFDGARVDLRPFERREGELLLAQDLMARHLINFVGGRLIRANEIEIARSDTGWEVVGVDPTAEVPTLADQRCGARPPAPIYADILRGGSSSSGNGQT